MDNLITFLWEIAIVTKNLIKAKKLKILHYIQTLHEYLKQINLSYLTHLYNFIGSSLKNVVDMLSSRKRRLVENSDIYKHR